MKSCFPMDYKSLLNSTILMLELSQSWPVETPSSRLMSMLYFPMILLLPVIVRYSRLTSYLLWLNPGFSHFLEELSSLWWRKVIVLPDTYFQWSILLYELLGPDLENCQFLGWWISDQVEMLGNEEGQFLSAVVKWRICIQSMPETKIVLVFICNPWLELARQMVVSFFLQPYFCWEGSGLHLMNMHILVLSHAWIFSFVVSPSLVGSPLILDYCMWMGRWRRGGRECILASSGNQPIDAIQYRSVVGHILVWEPHLEYCVGWGESQLQGCGPLFSQATFFTVPHPIHLMVSDISYCVEPFKKFSCMPCDKIICTVACVRD